MNDKIRRGTLLAAAVTGGGDDFYNPNPNYLTIVALEDGLTASLSTNDVEYSIDGNENWTTLTDGTASPAINTGQYISFRGNLTPVSRLGVGRFTISKSCDLTGNCNSLLFGDNAVNNNSLSGKSYVFYSLFSNCRTIKNISSNFLPATILADNCYNNMFYGCTSLTTAPALPATSLADSCYRYMFDGCSSLKIAPTLPATTLRSYCYCYMFDGCSSLKIAPTLPATTLQSSCYHSMFKGCISLTTSPKLPATRLVYMCYYGMFQDCTSLTTAPTLPAASLADSCYRSMFQDCTSLTTAPTLPATTLKDSCYNYMFYGCSKLNYIKAMFTTIPSSSYTNYWVKDVALTGTFVKNKNAIWDVTGEGGIPSGWTVQTA